MSMEQVIAAVRGFDHALVIVPGPGSGLPEQAWGDAFFYYAPGGQVPGTVQPYGTIVTKNQPGDTACDLDPPGRWRVNIQVGRAALQALTGEEPRGRDHLEPGADGAGDDRVLPHPLYGALGWVCVVNPGARTHATVVKLLRAAHDAARTRFERRHGTQEPTHG